MDTPAGTTFGNNLAHPLQQYTRFLQSVIYNTQIADILKEAKRQSSYRSSHFVEFLGDFAGQHSGSKSAQTEIRPAQMIEGQSAWQAFAGTADALAECSWVTGSRTGRKAD